jgi:hypothetical protein
MHYHEYARGQVSQRSRNRSNQTATAVLSQLPNVERLARTAASLAADLGQSSIMSKHVRASKDPAESFPGVALDVEQQTEDSAFPMHRSTY